MNKVENINAECPKSTAEQQNRSGVYPYIPKGKNTNTGDFRQVFCEIYLQAQERKKK